MGVSAAPMCAWGGIYDILNGVRGGTGCPGRGEPGRARPIRIPAEFPIMEDFLIGPTHWGNRVYAAAII